MASAVTRRCTSTGVGDAGESAGAYFEAAHDELFDQLLRQPDSGGIGEAVDPLLGVAGFAEDDRNDREPTLALGDPVGPTLGRTPLSSSTCEQRSSETIAARGSQPVG